MKLSVDNEQVAQPAGICSGLLVPGGGWPRSWKGDKLHGFKGSSEIRVAESDSEAEAYNLVVADVATYFVGEHGFLVHDNTPRSPTRGDSSGVIAKK